MCPAVLIVFARGSRMAVNEAGPLALKMERASKKYAAFHLDPKSAYRDIIGTARSALSRKLLISLARPRGLEPLLPP